MNFFSKLVSYLFHPLFIPIAGGISYFTITPKYSPPEAQYGLLLPILILTVVIPIITYFILKNVGVINGIFLSNVKERKYPMYIHLLLLFLVVYKVIPNYFTLELHFYFLGLIVSAMTLLMLLFFKMKASMHLAGIGALLMFLIGLSIHFEKNITLAISLLTLCTGIIATSRLYLKAHSKPELVIGFIVGLLSQLMLFRYWL